MHCPANVYLTQSKKNNLFHQKSTTMKNKKMSTTSKAKFLKKALSVVKEIRNSGESTRKQKLPLERKPTSVTLSRGTSSTQVVESEDGYPITLGTS